MEIVSAVVKETEMHIKVSLVDPSRFHHLVLISPLPASSLSLQYCERYSITRAQLLSLPESVTSIAYSRYVLDTSSKGDLLDLRVVTAPCLIGYGQVGARLVEGEGVGFDKSEGNPYWGWIAEYGGDWYQGAVKTGIGTSIPLLSRARMDVDVDGGSSSTRGDGCEESDLCEQVGGIGQDLCPGDRAGGGLLGRSSRCGRRVSVDDTHVCRWNQVHRIGCPVHSCHPRVSR